MNEITLDDDEFEEQPLPITPARTYVNASTKEPYRTSWMQVRTGASDHLKFSTKGNPT